MEYATFFVRNNALLIDNSCTQKTSYFSFFSDSGEAPALINNPQIPLFNKRNQPNIPPEYLTKTDTHKFSKHLTNQVLLKGGRISDIAFCHHYTDGPEKGAPIRYTCSIPSSGMLHKFSHQWQKKLKSWVLIRGWKTDEKTGIRAGYLKRFLPETDQFRGKLCRDIISNYSRDKK